MNFEQGTWQFMSVNLMTNTRAEHTFVDDLESIFWVLLWTCIVYSESALSINGWTRFIQKTFDFGTQVKENVLLQQAIFEPSLEYYSLDLQSSPLFPSRPSLNSLLKDLADLFRHCYSKPSRHNWMALESLIGREVDPQEIATDENCLTPDAMKAIMERLTEDRQKILKNLEVYYHGEVVARLSDHSYTINCFSRHLKSKDWPLDDQAVPQKFSEMDIWGKKCEGTTSLSKHILEEETEGSQKPRKKCRTRTCKVESMAKHKNTRSHASRASGVIVSSTSR